MVQVHRFDDSGEAYDMSQCSDDIHNGDVLVVDSSTERSVAFLMDAWPICVVPGFVTDRDTRFDCPIPGNTVEDVVLNYTSEAYVDTVPEFFDESLRVAREELDKLGGGRSAAIES